MDIVFVITLLKITFKKKTSMMNISNYMYVVRTYLYMWMLAHFEKGPTSHRKTMTATVPKTPINAVTNNFMYKVGSERKYQVVYLPKVRLTWLPGLVTWHSKSNGVRT